MQSQRYILTHKTRLHRQALSQTIILPTLPTTDVAIHEVLMEEVIKLLLFCRGEREHLGARELSPRCKVNGMVPCLPWWEFVKGLFGEDISKATVLDQHQILKGLAFLSLLGLLG